MHSPTTLQHDDVGGFVRSLMGFFADAKGAGTVFGPDCPFRPKTGRQLAPDGFFVARKRVRSPLPKKFDGIPDSVFEVLSPSNRNYDLGEKQSVDRQSRVREIWFIDSEYNEVLMDLRRPRLRASPRHDGAG